MNDAVVNSSRFILQASIIREFPELNRMTPRKAEADWHDYCRSTPARHATSPYQRKRHPNAQGETQTFKQTLELFLVIVHI